MIQEIKTLLQDTLAAGGKPTRIYLPPDAYQALKKHFTPGGKLMGLTVRRCSESFERVLIR